LLAVNFINVYATNATVLHHAYGVFGTAVVTYQSCVFRLTSALFMGHMATWWGKSKMRLRRPHKPWSNMLHGYLHAAFVHDPRGSQVCHRGNGLYWYYTL